MYSRFLVVNDEADKGSIFGGLVALPCQIDHMAGCDVGFEFQDMAFTCHGRGGPPVRHMYKVKTCTQAK